MLTNLYYYGFYRPYVLRVVEGGVQTVPRRGKITDKPLVEQGKDASFLLNKSLRADIISYARNVSRSVVGTKDSAKDLIIDMENFNKNTFNENLDMAKEWIREDLRHFTDTYNTSSEFLASQGHSKELRFFGANLAQTIEYSGESLRSLGLSFNEGGELVFDGAYFSALDQSALNVAIGENLNLFQSIYDGASDVLRAPLTEHMEFKGLNFYYNYKYGSIQDETFKIIESGMLVDKVV